MERQTLPADLEGLLALVRSATRLKSVARTGWLDRGVAPPGVESVADHSFAVALLAWIAALERRASGAAIQPERVLLLALVHDLAEAETGDQPPYDRAALPEDAQDRQAFLDRRHIRDPASAEAKRLAEDEAMRRLVDALPIAARSALGELWEELRAGATAEAKFVKQVDRLETFLQSRHYQTAQPGLPVASFEREVMETIDDPLLRALRDAALRTDSGRRG